MALRARRRANEALHGAHTGSLLCQLEAHAQMVHDQVGDGANPCVTLWLRGCLQLDLLRLLTRPVAYSEALAIALAFADDFGDDLVAELVTTPEECLPFLPLGGLHVEGDRAATHGRMTARAAAN